MKRSRLLPRIAVLGVMALVAAACQNSSSETGGGGTTGGPQSAPSFELRIGNIMSLTGDLSPYGPHIDEGARIAADIINETLKSMGLSDKISVDVVATEDDETKSRPAVEAATKLVQTDKVNVIIGPLASESAIAVAQSVTIQNQILQITPSSTDPGLTDIADGGYLWRTAPSDLLQAQYLAKVMADAFGADATINVGARNDAYGTGLAKAFADNWTAGGGTIGESVTWNPDAATFDTEAGKLVSGSPDGWLVIDFPETWAKVGPALVRTGQWDITRTFGADGLRDTTLPKSAGSEATEGMRGTSPTTFAPPIVEAFNQQFAQRAPKKMETGVYDTNAFDAVMVAFLAALEAGTSDPAEIKDHLIDVSGPGGTQYGFPDLQKAITDILAGKDIDYVGVSGPIDFDSNGDPSGFYDEWQFKDGKIDVLEQAVPVTASG